MHALLLPCCALALSAGVPPWVYLVALGVTLAFGRNAVFGQVPLYRSSPRVAEVLAETLPAGARVLEAGSGDARLAMRLARLRPDVTVVASESAWGSFGVGWCRWRLAGAPGNVALTAASFWSLDWSVFDAVYVFLSPAPMMRVWDKFSGEAQPDALLVSNTFIVPGVPPDRTLPLGGPLQKELLMWCRQHGTR
ncbi:class I SAM-dependent methyltransferase [Paludibacterium paludis]|nr:class I SAM-dependent methyltransferase [Paludibacterium paludis]